MAAPDNDSGQPRRGDIIECGDLAAAFDAVQSVRGVLAGIEHGVAAGCRPALVDRIGRDVDEAAGSDLVDLPVDSNLEYAFEHINPLLVGVTMRIAHLARGRPHQCNDHALALDTSSEHGGILRAAHNLIDLPEVEDILSGTRALGPRSHSLESIARLGLFRFCTHRIASRYRSDYSLLWGNLNVENNRRNRSGTLYIRKATLNVKQGFPDPNALSSFRRPALFANPDPIW
jgi:hypothetical protein